MRPRNKILDNVFNARAADKLCLRKAHNARLRVHIEDSEKVYEFKEVLCDEEYENVVVPYDYSSTSTTDSWTEIYRTSGSTDWTGITCY